MKWTSCVQYRVFLWACLNSVAVLGQSDTNVGIGYLHACPECVPYIITGDSVISLSGKGVVSLPIGRYRIWMKHPNSRSWNYRDFEAGVTVEASETTYVSVDFSSRPPNLEKPPTKMEHAAENRVGSPGHRRKSILRISSVAFTFVSGVLAYRYMMLAEESYESYLEAGNPRDMNRLFSKSAKLDRMAGYSLAATELGILLSFYAFFSSVQW